MKLGPGRWVGYLGKQVCEHTLAVSTEYAGLERRVCESCGHVSIRYLSNAVKIFPEEEAVTVDVSNRQMDLAHDRTIFCHRCHMVAEYMTPMGLACGAHAWGAASMQVARLGEMWIPIRIDPYENLDLD
ncbi:MAG: hypothetical protein ACRDVL_11495 [Acidimicrobiia bacterium]